MEFDLVAFTLSPTIEVFQKCRKKDLLVIADFYNLTVTKEAKKQVIKTSLFEQLVKAGILPGEVGEGPQGDTTVPEPENSLVGSESESSESMLEVRLKELDIQLKEKENENLHLKLRLFQAETDREIKLRALELETEKYGKPVPIPVTPMGDRHTVFDVGKFIKLVPPFRESEVDAYFVAFERIASKLKWPTDMWALLLQCSLTGKAQEVCASLPIEQSLEYETVKTAVLRAYELVPEAYRQKWRKHAKIPKQTHVEFAREKRVLFEKWCSSSKTTTFEQLQELILLEDLKSCLPEAVVVHLNEQKVTSLLDAAIGADEFVLTHRSIFPSIRSSNTPNKNPATRDLTRVFSRMPKVSARSDDQSAPGGKVRVCFYCRDPGHLIADCQAWNKKNAEGKIKKVALVQTMSEVEDKSLLPFLFSGSVSLTDTEHQPVVILRDTGAAQSFILQELLPFSQKSYTGTDVLVRGIEMGCESVPLHKVHLKSELVNRVVRLGVRSQLPIVGVGLILGNDLAGEKVFPRPIVTSKDNINDLSNLSQSSNMFPACAVTRAQAKKFADVVDVADSFMQNCTEPVTCELMVKPEIVPSLDKTVSVSDQLYVGKDQLIVAQKTDPTLTSCFEAAIDSKQVPAVRMAYFCDDGILMRKWKPADDDTGVNEVHQIVLPIAYRSQVLRLAHENAFAGHLGINKTFRRVTKYFYWPGCKTSVTEYCKTCDVCQKVGKPNQKVPVAPLHPVPVMGEPFERLILDCVGPLPKTKTGFQYVLTIMCTATRFPEAIPLRTIKSPVVVKALLKFCTTFGLPKEIQTDQGSNFTSKTFAQTLAALGVSHRMSSAYHPESQGALERYHQTLKNMIRAYCLDTGKEWDEGLPFLLFATREAVQESTGFSPADLVFGHTIRGPLKLLSEQLVAVNRAPVLVTEYVSSFRERLHHAWDMAKKHLSNAQMKMKLRFDKKSVNRTFNPGDRVLVLLPVPGSVLNAKFAGPYKVEQKLSDTDYVIATPDRKRRKRVCHVNMIKPYLVPSDKSSNAVSKAAPVVVPASSVSYCPVEDGLNDKMPSSSGEKGKNSTIFQEFPNTLSHLTVCQRKELIQCISKYPSVFSDKLGRTSVLTHDIDVGDSPPVKQHAYRVNPKKRQIMRDEVEYMLRHDLAMPSYSPWSSPCLLVPKPDASFRFCTDYRKVNKITKADSFPLPRMEDCVDRVGSASFVTKLDLLKGYWQVPLTPRASEISAFVTPDHFLQYKVLAFGMRNAPATFQRLMKKVLTGVTNCEIYIDDVVIYSHTWEHHIETLNVVFGRLEAASLTLNLAKCEFGKAVVTYLGKQVGQGCVRPVSAKVEAILQFPQPTNKRELRRFLGMAGYYRAFCRNFSVIVSPLTDLLSTTRKFTWSSECSLAFEAVKDLLCNAPVLSAPNFENPFKLQVDASATGVGAVLLQEDRYQIDHPVAYFSKKFSTCQRNYSTIEKEALALLLALQHFDVYVGGNATPLLVYTDHNPLIFLAQMSNSNQRLMRWALIIQEYNVDIQHLKGSENVVADALSRTEGAEK